MDRSTDASIAFSVTDNLSESVVKMKTRSPPPSRTPNSCKDAGSADKIPRCS